MNMRRFALLPVALMLGVHVHAAVPASVAGMEAGDAGVEDVTTIAVVSPAIVEFDPDMLQFPVDVRLFAQSNALPAGTYRVDLYTNEEWKGRGSVRFAMVSGDDRVAQPCFDLTLLETLGFDLAQLTVEAAASLQTGAMCGPLAALITGAQARYDSGNLRLDVAAPQILLRREARGSVDPALWEDGIRAGLLDYSYNGYRMENAGVGGSDTSHYLSLRAGFNLGAWRLRYQATANRMDTTGFQYHGNTATLERGISRWKSRLTLGDTVTDGRVFDSVRFRGLRLDSDERMRPDSQRGFAPVVRGMAQSNARVSIRQLGQEIYQINVPPGPFVIDDLYPTGISGDLLVVITEADGSEHSFTIAYAGMAELVRPGTMHYTVAAGRYENQTLVNEPAFMMGNLRRGLTNALTGSAGLLVGEGYTAISGGLAFNLPIGALATDFIFADTHTRAGNARGSSVRATWAKNLPVIGTNITVASYRYSSSGYYDPSAAFMLRDRIHHGGGAGGSGFPGTPVLPGTPVGTGAIIQTRNRLVVNANQNLPGGWGYLTITASTQDYWARDGRDSQYQVGWNRQLQRLSLGLSASRTHNVFRQRWENQYMLNLSLPLGGAGLYAHGHYTQREDGQAFNASISGLAGKNRQFGFGAFVSADERDGIATHYSGGANAAWETSRAQLGANVSTSRGGNRQYGVSLNGGVVAFGGGVMLTPRLGDTIAIIQAKNAGGVRLADQGGQVRLNRRGQAVSPYLQAYRQNRVTLDPQGLSTDVALISSTRQVAPTAGAVVLLEFETERGYSILVHGRLDDGRHLPFAAAVTDAHGQQVGYISQGGQALLRVHDHQGALTVRWGPGQAESCQFHYALDAATVRNTNTNHHDFRHMDVECTQAMIPHSHR